MPDNDEHETELKTQQVKETESSFITKKKLLIFIPVLIVLLVAVIIAGYFIWRSEEHTSELQSHSFISYAVFCLKKKKQTQDKKT